LWPVHPPPPPPLLDRAEPLELPELLEWPELPELTNPPELAEMGGLLVPPLADAAGAAAIAHAGPANAKVAISTTRFDRMTKTSKSSTQGNRLPMWLIVTLRGVRPIKVHLKIVNREKREICPLCGSQRGLWQSAVQGIVSRSLSTLGLEPRWKLLTCRTLLRPEFRRSKPTR